MKVILQPGLRGLSGSMGDWVYRIRNGKTILGMKSTKRKEQSQAQLNHQERFKEAAAYGRMALADHDLRPFYQEIAKQTGKPIFAVIVADFFKPPAISAWDDSGYHGQPGNILKVTTVDDTGVVRLQVNITDDQGASLESGQAVETLSGNGNWVYTAQTAVPAGKTITVNVVATDRPGNTAVYNHTINL